MNRAERRRRGLTRSRMARTGSLASAGVLMSVGLFGAYTGSPRIQRAYASAGCTQQGTAHAYDDTSLRDALLNSSVICIEIDGDITLNSQSDLPFVNYALWDNSPRETAGLTIFGTGDDTIHGNGNIGFRVNLDQALDPVDANVKLNISDVTLSDFSGTYGAAVYVYLRNQPHDAEVVLNGVTIHDNSSDTGAAVYVAARTTSYYAQSNVSSTYVTVSASDFSGNVAKWGGALYAFSDDTTLAEIGSSTFTQNSAIPSGYGGAAFVNAGKQADVVIDGASQFIDNHSDERGGALSVGFNAGSTGSVSVGEGATFTGNTSDDKGGAIYAMTDVDVLGGTAYPTYFGHNEATATGGAISAAGSVQVGAGAQFSYNESVTWGGAIYAKNSVDVTGTTTHPVSFDHNQAASGGAIHVRDQGGDIALSTFTANHALTGDGGAVLNYFAGPLAINSSTFEGNAANAGDGGAIWSGGDTVIQGSSVIDNVADNRGGGILGAWGYDVALENSFVGDNTARRGGGVWLAPYMSGPGDLTLNFTSIYDDTVATGGSDPTPGLPTPASVYANNITSTGSLVGSMTTTDIWSLTGTIDDTDSVSTASGTTFANNVAPGTLNFGPMTGSDPGEQGKTPDSTSVLALPAAAGGFAPLTNPLPLVTHDQLGNLRIPPFTIGARSAVAAPTPSVTSVTPPTGSTAGGDSITIHGSGFTGAAGASIGGTSLLNFAVVDDTTITGVTPSGSAGGATVTVTGPGGTGSLPNGFTFVAPTPPGPNPPAPTPAERASAPRDVRAEAGVESATAAWLPPTSTGSFPVTSYQAVASPGRQTCMVAAPALTCTITGLTPGKPYTVTARALTGAGWSEASAPSSAVVPLGPEVPTILITNSRDRAQKSMARIEGTTTGLIGAEVVPYLRMAGQADFTPGASTRTVDADGNFVWQRKAKKRFTVYFVSGDVTSNRLVIRPE